MLLIRDMVVESCNRRFDRETIHPTYLFLTSMRLLEVNHHTATAHFGTLTQRLVHPTVPKFAFAVWCVASNSLHGGQNKYAYVITQDICNKFIEVFFFVGCMV